MGSLFKKKPTLTASEAWTLAQEELPAWNCHSDSQLCCLYTGVMDSNHEIGRDGRCRAWHLDFYSPALEEALLIRVEDGKASTRRHRDSESEYVHAITKVTSEVPSGWVDSPALVEAAFASVELPEKEADRYAPLCLFAPARSAVYEPPLLPVPLKGFHFLCILAHENVEDHPSFAVWLDLEGKCVRTHQMKFPDVFDYGFSKNW